jgi:TPR repeat protein
VPIAIVCALVATQGRADGEAGLQGYRSGDYKTALREFSQGAEAGDARAQYNLGIMLLRGTGVAQDTKAAIAWHRRAAELGYAAAQHGLGVIYYRGKIIKRDHGEAAKWFRKAAEQDFAQSQLNLGVMYLTGQGVPKDGAEVVKWVTLAAASGLAEAQYRLGAMYDKGIVFRANGGEAARWYGMAAKQGHRKAVDALAVLSVPGPDAPPSKKTNAAASPAKAATPKTQAPRTAAAPAAASETKRWGVQLAALRNAGAAETEVRRLRRSLGGLLDGLETRTVAVDLGPERGTAHRLILGSFPSRAAALSLCREIRQRSPRQGCLPRAR